MAGLPFQQAMLTLTGMAEHRYSNLYNYQCLTCFYVTELTWTGPLARLCLSSSCLWIMVRVFDPEYCSLPVLYYHQMNVEVVSRIYNILETTVETRIKTKHGHLIL